MGMTIEEARAALGKERKYALHENKQAFDIAIDVMRKYQMMQADYNARLKADIVAMLTEIQLEIEEWSILENTQNKNRIVYMKRVDEIIQQKINALKAESEEA